MNGGNFLIVFIERFLSLVKRFGEKAEIQWVTELSLNFLRNNNGRFTFVPF